MDKVELKKLLERKLPAKPTIDEMAFHIRSQQKLISYLVSSLVTQGASIIALRKENVEVQADLLAAGIGTTKQEEGSSIIMPDREIVRPN